MKRWLAELLTAVLPCVLLACGGGGHSVALENGDPTDSAPGDGGDPSGDASVAETAACNNGVVEVGETCDGNCPATCADGDECTNDVQLGDPSTCDMVCLHEPIADCDVEVTEVPSAPVSGDWRVSDAVSDGRVYLAVDAIPAGVTRVEWARADTGPWESTDHVTPGVFFVEGLSNNQSYDFYLRFSNALGAGVASAAKTVTPTAAGNQRMACWADGEKRHWLTERPTNAGSAPAMSEGVNQPFVVAGGGEAEVMDWESSPFKTQWGINQFTGDYWSAPPDPGDSIFYDPLGSARSLRPAESEQRVIHTSIGATAIVVHGAAGMVTWEVNSLVGFGTDGHPAFFRFDRTYQGGRLPDRRPFVVGPVNIVHNGGDPIAITPDAMKGYSLVSLDGASLCVVSRPGIIPPLTASASDLRVVRGYSQAYSRRRGVYDFALDGWDESAADAASSTGLTLRPTFESVGVYADLSGAATCRVRFRRQGEADFHPAHELWYDDRDHSGYPSVDGVDILAAKHRGVIIYLEPGTTYEVQVKQGTTYRKAMVTTWSHDVDRVSLELGHVVGDVELSKSGENITVTRAGESTLTADLSGGKWLELHSGSVRGSVFVEAGVSRVVFRDIDRFGGGADGFKLEDGVSDIRIVGGQSSGGGSKAVFWAKKNDCEVSAFEKQQSHSISLIGRFVGSPRYAANTWAEKRGDGDIHPYGVCVFARHRSIAGRLVMSDCAVMADAWRTYGDIYHGSGENRPGLGVVGSTGPDHVVAWNTFRGWADDAIELEGQVTNGVHIHNYYNAAEMRPGTYLVAAVSHSWVASGPVMGARNMIAYSAADGRAQSEGVKLKSHKDQALKWNEDEPAWASTKMGRRYYYHETIVGSGGLVPNGAVSGSGGPVLGVHACNTLHQAKGSFAPSGGTNHACASYATSTADTLPASLALDANSYAIGSELVGNGEWIFNINDGGPFYEDAPSIGAQRAP